MAAPVGSVRDQQREQTRQRLYEAALEVFRARGVAEAGIDEIVRRAGTSRGSFYFHFPTKEGVLEELLARSVARVARMVEALPEDTPVEQVFCAVGSAIAKQWESDARIFPDVAMVALKNTSSAPAAESGHPLRMALARRVALAAARGEVTGAASPDMLSDLFLLNQFAVALAWAGRRDQQLPLAGALHGAAALFLRGAAAPRPD